MKLAVFAIASVLTLAGCSAPSENGNGVDETQNAVVEQAESSEESEGSGNAAPTNDGNGDLTPDEMADSEAVDEVVVEQLSEDDLCVEYNYYEEQVNNALEGLNDDFDNGRIVYSEVIFELGVEAQGFAGPDGRVQDKWVDWTEALVNFGRVGQIETRKYTSQLAEEAVEYLTRMEVASTALNSLCLTS